MSAANHRLAVAEVEAREKARQERESADGKKAAEDKAVADGIAKRLEEEKEKQTQALIDKRVADGVAAELAKRAAADKNGDGKVSKAEGAAAGVAPGPVNPNAPK